MKRTIIPTRRVEHAAISEKNGRGGERKGRGEGETKKRFFGFSKLIYSGLVPLSGLRRVYTRKGDSLYSNKPVVSLAVVCVCAYVPSFCAALFFLSPSLLISSNNRQLQSNDPRPPVECRVRIHTHTHSPSFCRLLALEINELRACVCMCQ